MMKVEKRDFKNISNIGQITNKKMLLQNPERIKQEYSKAEVENIDSKSYPKFGMIKGRSHQPKTKEDALSNNYVQISEKKYKPFTSGASSKSSLNKFKYTKDSSLTAKEITKDAIQFHPGSSNIIASPSDQKNRILTKRSSSYKTSSSPKKM